MSVHLTALVWDIEFPTHVQKLTMLRLADYANDDGYSIFPAVNTLAQQIGCDPRSVQRTLNTFDAAGVLIKLHSGGGGPKDTNKWRLNADKLCELALQQCRLVGSSKTLKIEVITEDIHKDGTTPPLPSRRVASAAKRVASVSNKGGTSATQTISNHQLEPSGAQARAKIGQNGLKSGSPLSAIHITDHELSFQAWVDELHSRGEYKLADKARCTGSLIVADRWPLKTSRLPKVPPEPPEQTAKKKAQAITKETD